MNIEKYDIAYLESEASGLIKSYMTERDFYAEITSCHVFIQNNQVFVFFEYESLDGNALVIHLTEDVIERIMFYGYAKIEKRFDKYNIVDFGVANEDKETQIKGASRHVAYLDSTQYRFGKILDSEVDRIEFYSDGLLLGTYNVVDKDYYFIELSSNNHSISCRFYDKENNFLYE